MGYQLMCASDRLSSRVETDEQVALCVCGKSLILKTDRPMADGVVRIRPGIGWATRHLNVCTDCVGLSEDNAGVAENSVT